MTQGQPLRVLNEAATRGLARGGIRAPRMWTSTSSGTPSGSGRCLMEVGFSCMGGEIPAALGVRMARPKAGEVYALIGDGT